MATQSCSQNTFLDGQLNLTTRPEFDVQLLHFWRSSSSLMWDWQLVNTVNLFSQSDSMIHSTSSNFTEYLVTLAVKEGTCDFTSWPWNTYYYMDFSILPNCDSKRIVMISDLLLDWQQLPSNWRPALAVLLVYATRTNDGKHQKKERYVCTSFFLLP